MHWWECDAWDLMQVTIQPLRRQSHTQPDTLVLFWQPAVPKEHLTCLWQLTRIASSRVTSPYTLPSRPSLLGAFLGGQGWLQCVCVSTSVNIGLYRPVNHSCGMAMDGLLEVLCNHMTAICRRQAPHFVPT